MLGLADVPDFPVAVMPCGFEFHYLYWGIISKKGKENMKNDKAYYFTRSLSAALMICSAIATAKGYKLEDVVKINKTKPLLNISSIIFVISIVLLFLCIFIIK